MRAFKRKVSRDAGLADGGRTGGPVRRAFDPAEESHRERRHRDATMGWREWLGDRYAKYWFAVGVLFLDIVVSGLVLQGDSPPVPPWRYGVALAFVLGSAYPAVLLYRRLWPRGEESVP